MTMTAGDLAIVRRAYVKQVLAARVADERVEAAFGRRGAVFVVSRQNDTFAARWLSPSDSA